MMAHNVTRSNQFLALLLPFLMLVPACRPGSPLNQRTSEYAVKSVTLINADTDQPIPEFDPIPDGAKINLAKLPTRNLNIRANTSPEKVGKVLFRVINNNAGTIVEGPPYAMYGYARPVLDSQKGYLGQTPALGVQTLMVSPHDGNNPVGTSVTVTYTLIDEK